MAVSLYTSRVVLSALGVEDFGIYNVVGGIVSFIGFLNGTLSTASSRYITVALGRRDMQRMQQTFASVLQVNMVLSLIVIIMGETIGLWFLLQMMSIPVERISAAIWVYQFSILTVVTSFLSVPYNATIIAHEQMKAFAYLSLFDAFAKLGIAYYLSVSQGMDRLILYAVLLFAIQATDRVLYGWYCIRNFPETKYKPYYEKGLMREMAGFISWSAYGSFVSVGFSQGLNILLNLFFGPVVNAARGIAVQVQNAVVAFSTNFQTAVNPQLTKSVAVCNFAESRRLLSVSSRMSFFLLCILGVPLITEAHFILNIWLVEIPENTVKFVQLMLIICIWQSLAYPLRVINQAEGQIKKFQIYECSWLLLVVPVSYIVLKNWQIPMLVFIVHLIVELTAHLIRLYIVLPKIDLSFQDYFHQIYRRIFPVFVIPLIIGFSIQYMIIESWGRFVITLFVQELLISLLILYVGIDGFEKSKIISIIKQKFRK